MCKPSYYILIERKYILSCITVRGHQDSGSNHDNISIYPQSKYPKNFISREIKNAFQVNY